MAQINQNEQILQKLDDLSTEVKALRTDTREIKADVALSSLRLHQLETVNKAMQTDISDLKTDVKSLKKDMKLVKTDLRHQGVMHEQTESDIKQVAETLSQYAGEAPQMREHNLMTDDKILFHERRIRLLETKLA